MSIDLEEATVEVERLRAIVEAVRKLADSTLADEPAPMLQTLMEISRLLGGVMADAA